MSQELLYTSAPKGLRPGSRGFCTVACTQGMPPNLVERLESLSGYRQLYPPDSPQAGLNPVVHTHLRLAVGGIRYHVLSRVAAAGLDYSGRTNKLAHHVVLAPRELSPAGPAWLLSSAGFMQTSWQGEPELLPIGRRPPQGTLEPNVCRAWRAATGDAGWAGVLAATAAETPMRPAFLIFEPGMELLPLLVEAQSLLPPKRRWAVTFSTYFTKLPPGVDCQWRCVLAGSPEAKAAYRTSGAEVIDLTKKLAKPPAHPLVAAARTGSVVLDDEATHAAAPPQLTSPTAPPPSVYTTTDATTTRTGPPRLAKPKKRRRVLRAIATISILLLATAGGLAIGIVIQRQRSESVVSPAAVVAAEPVEVEDRQNVEDTTTHTASGGGRPASGDAEDANGDAPPEDLKRDEPHDPESDQRPGAEPTGDSQSEGDGTRSEDDAKPEPSENEDDPADSDREPRTDGEKRVNKPEPTEQDNPIDPASLTYASELKRHFIKVPVRPAPQERLKLRESVVHLVLLGDTTDSLQLRRNGKSVWVFEKLIQEFGSGAKQPVTLAEFTIGDGQLVVDWDKSIASRKAGIEDCVVLLVREGGSVDEVILFRKPMYTSPFVFDPSTYRTEAQKIDIKSGHPLHLEVRHLPRDFSYESIFVRNGDVQEVVISTRSDLSLKCTFKNGGLLQFELRNSEDRLVSGEKLNEQLLEKNKNISELEPRVEELRWRLTREQAPQAQAQKLLEMGKKLSQLKEDSERLRDMDEEMRKLGPTIHYRIFCVLDEGLEVDLAVSKN